MSGARVKFVATALLLVTLCDVRLPGCAMAQSAGEDADEIMTPTGPQIIRYFKFTDNRTVDIVDSSGKRTWSGVEAKGSVVKPGTVTRTRDFAVLNELLTKKERRKLLRYAKKYAEFENFTDSVDGAPTREATLLHKGGSWVQFYSRFVLPILKSRVIPYLRERFNIPGLVPCQCIIRSYVPGERRTHGTHFDDSAQVTAVIALGSGYHGGLYVQATASMHSRRFFRFRAGDLISHQFDLNHGVHVYAGTRYSLVLWLKENQELCTNNETPWHDAPAREGDADALSGMAMKFQMQTDKPEMSAQSLGWLKKAAELGQYQAMAALAYRYIDMPEVPDRMERATKLWRGAAEQGDGVSAHNLALAYYKGDGVPRDMESCRNWLQFAASEGHQEAADDLKSLPPAPSSQSAAGASTAEVPGEGEGPIKINMHDL